MKTLLVIFGITGDLSTRKLLPALGHIINEQQALDLHVLGVSRRAVNVNDLVLKTTNNQALAAITSLLTLDVAAPADYERLKLAIAGYNADQTLIYLAVPPGAAASIVDLLGRSGLNGANVRLLFEKPFGFDLGSAQDFIDRTGRYYDEKQLFRIDHYLAKEMAQNIVAFRGGNALFSHIWNNNFIESISVVAHESIGIEGRALFYEQTGALRDVLQGHLMQLLALVLMDIPAGFDWDELPALRLKALKQVRPASPALAQRAQYVGYQQEVGNAGSLTETYARLELESDQLRWQGVPLILETGKALPDKTTEIRIKLKRIHEAQSNQLTFRIQPNEGIGMELFIKKPGYERSFTTRELGFAFDQSEKLPDAYEQVLVDAIYGRKSLFTSSEEVLRSWEILKPVQDAWNMDDALLVEYPQGTYPLLHVV